MKVLVITIGTGLYSKYIVGMLPTLRNISPGADRDILLFSSEYAELELDRPNIGTIKIDHYPWPIITCVKFHNILRALDLKRKPDGSWNYDYVVYLDSVMRARKAIELDKLPKDKYTVFNHFLWDFITPEQRLNLHNKNKSSFAWIPEEERTQYIHAGMAIATPEMMYQLAQSVQSLMNSDLKNWSIPTWHDESEINKYYHDFPQLFNVIEHEVYDESCPSRHPRPMNDYYLSFVDCHDCQKLKDD